MAESVMAQFSFRYGVNELWLGVGVTVAWTVLMAAATFLALIFLDRENPPSLPSLLRPCLLTSCRSTGNLSGGVVLEAGCMAGAGRALCQEEYPSLNLSRREPDK